MDRNARSRRLRAPSPAMIVALIALVFSMGGSAVAATQLVNGDKLVKKSTLSGNRLRNQTVTGSKIKLSTVGKVPKAALADTAANATNATNAANAANAANATNAAHATTADTVADGAIGTAKVGAIPGARVRGTTTSVNSSSLTPLTFATEDFDVGDLHSANSAERLTAPVAGKYLIMASVRWNANTNGRRILIIQRNASGQQIARDSVSPYYVGSALYPEQTIETVYQLAAGDYIWIRVWQDSGSTLNVEDNGGAGPYLSMNWLAP